jgi:hypothetical protein
MPDPHLSRAELLEWRDDGAGDRERIVTHLAACAVCRQTAAELERHRPAEGPPVHLDVDEYVGRGYRAGAAGRQYGAWRWLAAAAALLAVVLLPAWFNRVNESATVTRGGAASIQPLQPRDTDVSADNLTFEWTGVSAEARVRLNVTDLDRPDEPLIEREVTGTRYSPTAEVALPAGTDRVLVPGSP